MTRKPQRPLVGRGSELAQLEEVLGEAEAGEPGVVMVSGEAGIGKTRLLQELCKRARADGFVVLAGGCHRLGSGQLPYGPFVEAFRSLRDSDLVTGLGARARDGLAPVLAAHTVEPAESGLSGQGRLFELVHDLLHRTAQAHPVLLVLEDVHWADQGSLDLLLFLVRNLSDERLCVVITERTSGLEQVSTEPQAVLVALDNDPVVLHLPLEALSARETGQLASALAGSPVDAATVERIHRRAQGNPFHTEVLLASAAGRPDAPLPRHLRDLLLLAVDQLPPPAREVLATVALGGSRIHHVLLERVMAAPPQTVETVLRAAVAAQILVVEQDTHLAFRHVLTAEAVSDDLLPGERRRLHERLAEEIAKAPELLGDEAVVDVALAHHWSSAGRSQEALEPLVHAGEAAAASHANADAVEYFSRALELWPRVREPEVVSGRRHVDVLRAAAEAAGRSGDATLAIDLSRRGLQEVDDRADPDTAAAIWLRLARCLWQRGESTGALEAAANPVRMLADRPPSRLLVQARGVYGAALMVNGRYEESIRESRAALDIALALDACSEESYARTSLGVALCCLGNLDAGIEEVREGLAVGQACHDPDAVSRAQANLAHVLALDGRLTEAVQHAAGARDHARRHGQFGSEIFAAGNEVELRVALGQWREARALIDALLPRNLPESDRARTYLLQARLAVADGDLDECDQALIRARELSAAHRDPQNAELLMICTVEADLAHDAPGDALRDVMAALRNQDQRQWLDTNTVLRLCSLGLRALGDLRERRSLGEELLAIEAERLIAFAREDDGCGESLREAANLRALCFAEYARAEGHSDPALWERAVDGWRREGQDPAAAYALFRLAEAALVSRDRSTAERAAGEAREICARIGAVALGREVEELVRRARLDAAAPIPEQRPPDADRLHLTPREYEVLQQLATGASNRLIARALFISEKTVSVHMSHIMDKLDAASRAEAAMIAYRLGLVPPPRPLEDRRDGTTT